jgi:hypothetical protein
VHSPRTRSATSTSRRKRARNCASNVRSARSSFTATSSPRFQRPRYTSPMPPWPIRPWMTKGPIRRGSPGWRVCTGTIASVAVRREHGQPRSREPQTTGFLRLQGCFPKGEARANPAPNVVMAGPTEGKAEASVRPRPGSAATSLRARSSSRRAGSMSCGCVDAPGRALCAARVSLSVALQLFRARLGLMVASLGSRDRGSPAGWRA